MKDNYTVESYDNQSLRVLGRVRASECGAPFGYVYFTDGTRVMYRTLPEEVISGANWGPTTPRHKALAKEMLVQQGIFKS